MKVKDRRFLKNVKVIPGILQHGMVVMDVVSKWWGKREKEKFVPRRRTWLLKDVEIKKEFERKVVKNWERECNDRDIWDRYRDCVLEAADEVCG